MCDKSAYDPSPLLRHVFEEHVNRYGDPDIVYHFGGDADPADRMDAYVWQASPSVPVTTFTTLGMSDRAMTGCDHRCELHWTIRGRLNEETEKAAAAFLANLAAFPFATRTHFDYWHLLPSLPEIPAFGLCSAGLFHPTFVEGGWDRTTFGTLTIRILNFVPLTSAEANEARTKGVNALLARLQSEGIDIFSNRGSTEKASVITPTRPS